MFSLLGHSEFGFEVLKLLLKKSLKISYVTSKKFNRRHTDNLFVKFSDLCKKNNIPFLINKDVNEDFFINLNKSEKVKFCIIGGYDGILKSDYINSVEKVINTHFGIIPRNRGCNPTIWDILSGQNGGFTTYEVSEKIDLGNILEQKEVVYSNNITSEELYNLILNKSIENYSYIIDCLYNSEIKYLKPISNKNIYHSSDMPNNRFVSWNWKTEFINRFYRSLKFGNYPTIRTIDENQNIFELEPVKFSNKNYGKPGTTEILKNGNKIINTIDGTLEVKNLQTDKNLINIQDGKYYIPSNFSEVFLNDTYF